MSAIHGVLRYSIDSSCGIGCSIDPGGKVGNSYGALVASPTDRDRSSIKDEGNREETASLAEEEGENIVDAILSEMHTELKSQEIDEDRDDAIHRSRIDTSKLRATRLVLRPPWLGKQDETEHGRAPLTRSTISCSGGGDGDSSSSSSSSDSSNMMKRRRMATTQSSHTSTEGGSFIGMNRSSIGSDDDDDDDRRWRRKAADARALTVTLVHANATPLELVGQQLWRATLLLADYLLHSSSSLLPRAEEAEEAKSSTSVVELGAGLGLLGIVAAMCLASNASSSGEVSVFVTDRDDQRVLNLAQRNVAVNRHLYCEGNSRPLGSDLAASGDGARVRLEVRALDWLATWPPVGEPARRGEVQRDATGSRSNRNAQHGTATRSKCPYAWSTAELRALRKDTRLVLCADCIYDRDLVDGLFSTLRAILAEQPDARCLLALEKRYNFELESLSVQAHGYRAFLKHIGRLGLLERNDEKKRSRATDPGPSVALDAKIAAMEEPTPLEGVLIPTEAIPQYFSGYERVPQLELWELKARKKK